MMSVEPDTRGRRGALRDAMGPLVTQLWAGAANGAVSRTDFDAAVQPLALDGPGLARLESGLQAMGLKIAPAVQPLATMQTAAAGTAVVRTARASKPKPAPSEVRTDADAIAAARQRIDADRRIRDSQRQYELLTAEEEVGLSLLLRGWPDPDAVTMREAGLAALKADDIRRVAYETIVAHNMRLAHKVCQGLSTDLLPYEDLVHEATFGLMRAACKFDPAAGFKFSTYAVHWLRQTTSRAIADLGNIIRIPVHLHEDIHKVAAAEARLRAQGSPANAVDVAVATGLTIEKVDTVRRISRVTDSLDREVVDGANLGDLISDDYSVPAPEDELRSRWLREDIEGRLLVRLTEREADVMRRRAGMIDDGDGQTLDEIGIAYGVTRERIRQVESKARGKVREFLEADGWRWSASRGGPRV